MTTNATDILTISATALEFQKVIDMLDEIPWRKARAAANFLESKAVASAKEAWATKEATPKKSKSSKK